MDQLPDCRIQDFLDLAKKLDSHICLHQFERGYVKKLQTIKFKEKWPFDESEAEWVEKYDAVLFIEGSKYGTLIAWTRDEGLPD